MVKEIDGKGRPGGAEIEGRSSHRLGEPGKGLPVQGHVPPGPEKQTVILHRNGILTAEVEIAMEGRGENRVLRRPRLPLQREPSSAVQGVDRLRRKHPGKPPLPGEGGQGEANARDMAVAEGHTLPDAFGKARGTAVETGGSLVGLQGKLPFAQVDGSPGDAPRHGAAEDTAPGAVTLIFLQAVKSQDDIFSPAGPVRDFDGMDRTAEIEAPHRNAAVRQCVEEHPLSTLRGSEKAGGHAGRTTAQYVASYRHRRPPPREAPAP